MGCPCPRRSTQQPCGPGTCIWAFRNVTAHSILHVFCRVLGIGASSQPLRPWPWLPGAPSGCAGLRWHILQAHTEDSWAAQHKKKEPRTQRSRCGLTSAESLAGAAPSTSGSTLPQAAQGAIGVLGGKGTLPAPVQRCVHWDPQVLFWKAAFRTAGPQRA